MRFAFNPKPGKLLLEAISHQLPAEGTEVAVPVGQTEGRAGFVLVS